MQTKFTVIKGGNTLPPSKREYRFRSGFATDTRLMGVVGLYLSWEVIKHEFEGDTSESLEQIFYLDGEERFVESYTDCSEPGNMDFFKDRERMIAALGARTVPITEKEARFLVQHHSKGKRMLAEEQLTAYRFILKPEVSLSPRDYQDLMDRICGVLPSPTFVINYFLMRAAATDVEGMAYLSENGGFSEGGPITPGRLPDRYVKQPFNLTKPSTYCMNRTEPQLGSFEYACHSLTERNDFYYLSTTELTLTETLTRVRDARLISEFRITDIEAAMQLRRSEFVTVFQVGDDDEPFRKAFKNFVSHCTDNIYRNGHLYVEFNPNNNHVGKPEYRLNDDVKAVFYLSNQGQLIIMSYNADTCRRIEQAFMLRFLQHGLSVTARYEFPEPVLYEYINSDYDDFMELLELLMSLTENNPDK